MKRFCFTLLCCVTLFTFSQAAEPDRIAQLEAQIKTLTARIETLEAQIKLLTALPPTPTPKPAPAGIPADIDATIKQAAIAEYPTDNSLQLYTIKKERAAYLDIQTFTADIPADVLSDIKAAALAEYPNDYSLQLYTIKKEIQAYKEVHQ
jgi:hypothetical protein